MQSAAAGKSKSSQPAGSRVTRFEDAFAGDVVGSPAAQSKTAVAEPMKKRDGSDAGAESTPETAKKSETIPAKKAADANKASRQATRAASLLKLGQNLEKADKTTAALGYYRQVVKDFAGTPAAKTAAERIKAIEQK